MTLAIALPPMLFAVFAWWFSTGAILYLDGLPRSTYRWSLLGGTGVLVLGLYGLMVTKNDTSVAGAYCATTSALMIWVFHEMSFLMGVITGPRQTNCPEGTSGFRRFNLAFSTILYHEFALAITAAILAITTQGAANRFGLWTFLLLWGLRISAKLNVFFGVANLSEEFLPLHLRYLATYFVKKPMNLLFPVSVTLATAVTFWMAELAGGHGTSGEATGFAFLVALSALGVLEHWFMVLPLPTAALWTLGMKSHRSTDIKTQIAHSGEA